MADGRTSWWAKDAAWWRRESVVELLEDVGLAGPAVVDWLACEAKAQNAGGVVKAGERTIARGLGIDLVTVGHALSRAVAVGLLDDFEQDGRTFTCRISGWRSEQERANAATRKAREREKAAACHGESHPVTDGHKESHKQDKTGHITTESENGRDRAAEAALFPSLPAVLDGLLSLDGYMTDAAAVAACLAAHPWAQHDDLMSAVADVRAWCVDPVDPPRMKGTAAVLRVALHRRASERHGGRVQPIRRGERLAPGDDGGDAARARALRMGLNQTTEGAA